MKKNTLKTKNLWSCVKGTSFYLTNNLLALELSLRPTLYQNIASNIDPALWSNIGSNLYSGFDDSLDRGLGSSIISSLEEKSGQQ